MLNVDLGALVACFLILSMRPSRRDLCVKKTVKVRDPSDQGDVLVIRSQAQSVHRYRQHVPNFSEEPFATKARSPQLLGDAGTYLVGHATHLHAFAANSL